MNEVFLDIPEKIVVNGKALVYDELESPIEQFNYIQMCMKLGCSILRYPGCELIT